MQHLCQIEPYGGGDYFVSGETDRMFDGAAGMSGYGRSICDRQRIVRGLSVSSGISEHDLDHAQLKIDVIIFGLDKGDQAVLGEAHVLPSPVDDEPEVPGLDLRLAEIFSRGGIDFENDRTVDEAVSRAEDQEVSLFIR